MESRGDDGRRGRASAPASKRVRTSTAAETEAVGARLAEHLNPGDVVLVRGELGAGKTTLVRGACRALGVTVPVTSPTFTLGQRYKGSVPVSHLDLFRLEGLELEEPDLLAEYLGVDAIVFVEWPCAGIAGVAVDEQEPGDRPRVVRRITIEHAGDDQRLIEIA